MQVYRWGALVALLGVSVSREAKAERAPSVTPVSLTAPDAPVWAHTVRFGPAVFGAVGPAGTCDCWVPIGSFATGGVRVDYVLQKGRENVRWHNIASLEMGWGVHTQPYQPSCADSATCACEGVDCSVTSRTRGPLAALFLGTGFRVDTSPRNDTALLFELDGTIGVSMAPHVGLVGLHLATGVRVAAHWEILASVEADVLAYAHASASVVVGHSL